MSVPAIETVEENEKPGEGVAERIVKMPGRALYRAAEYVAENPLGTAGAVLKTTAGLAIAKHAGLLQHIPATGGWNMLRTAVEVPAGWSQSLWSFLGTGGGRVAGNLNVPEWLSGGARRLLIDSWRNALIPTGT